MILYISSYLIPDAKRAWPNLIQLSESMHQLFGHSFEVMHKCFFCSYWDVFISDDREKWNAGTEEPLGKEYCKFDQMGVNEGDL